MPNKDGFAKLMVIQQVNPIFQIVPNYCFCHRIPPISITATVCGQPRTVVMLIGVWVRIFGLSDALLYLGRRMARLLKRMLILVVLFVQHPLYLGPKQHIRNRGSLLGLCTHNTLSCFCWTLTYTSPPINITTVCGLGSPV